MPWWRKLLALLGLTSDARVRVRAPGIEVLLTGDAELVRAILSVVKGEIARHNSKKRLENLGELPRHPGGHRRVTPTRLHAAHSGNKSSDSQVVHPSELDENDSPYAIPEHHAAGAAGDAAETETPVESTAMADSTSPGTGDLDEREVTVADSPSYNAGIKPQIVPAATEPILPVARANPQRATSRSKAPPNRGDS